jgi:hypothetical protein
MTTDFRALCAELLAWAERTSAHYVVPPHVILRARAALAAPEQGPTDAELIWLADQIEDEGLWQVDLVRRALTRWGRPAVEPVPVAERPWERDGWCDKEGMCWMGDGGGRGFVPSWRLCKPSDSCLAWSLPHWALPVPQEGADG